MPEYGKGSRWGGLAGYHDPERAVNSPGKFAPYSITDCNCRADTQ